MGIIKRGILGGFSGKVANVVGSSWKGKAVIKSLPLSVANPRTINQQNVRRPFKSASQIASGMLNVVIKPIWNKFYSDQSGYNGFVGTNSKLIKSDGKVDVDTLIVSKGNIGIQPITSAIYEPVNDTVQVSWDSTVVPANSTLDDEMIVAIVSADGFAAMAHTDPDKLRRNNGVRVPTNGFIGSFNFNEVYLMSISPDGSQSSVASHAPVTF